MTTEKKPPQAFIDEYGQANLDTSLPDIGTHFILTAILVEHDAVDAARAAVDAVRAKHFQTGELRSKRLANDPERFRRVLEDLKGLPFKFVALVVDKVAIHRDSGLADKDSFHEFLAGILYRKLFGAFPSLHATADAFGREDFMEGFARYVFENHHNTLFDRPRLTFVDSQAEPLVQLADIVCGMLARTYDETKTTERAAELLEILRPDHALVIDEWPPRFRSASGTGALLPGDPQDDEIARYSVARAEAFLGAHESEARDEVRSQVIVLKKLLYETRFGDRHGWISAPDLQQSLETFDEARNEHWLRSNVIARLRDAGVLIASSTHGYKIPVAVADLLAFVDRVDSIVHPLLNRVARAREAIGLVTQGRVDLLAGDKFSLLRAAVDSTAAVKHDPTT